jgi:predicted kinase
MKLPEILKEIEKRNVKLVIVRGISGGGKSTLSKAIMSHNSDMKHFEADMYFMQGGEYNFDGTKLGRAHEWCQNSTFKELAGGGRVIVSNTNTTHREIKPYVDMCKSLGVAYMIVKCIGKWQNVHNVPDAVLDKMRDRWQNVDGEVTYEP